MQQFDSTCYLCPCPASHGIVFLDDTDKLSVCLDHFGHGYDEAQTAIDTHGAFFTIPHITKLGFRVARELVPA